MMLSNLETQNIAFAAFSLAKNNKHGIRRTHLHLCNWWNRTDAWSNKTQIRYGGIAFLVDFPNVGRLRTAIVVRAPRKVLLIASTPTKSALAPVLANERSAPVAKMMT